MKRIKTNIIELDKLFKKPSANCLSYFKNGKVEADVLFKNCFLDYDWLYVHSPYDVIGWEIEHNKFDWKKYSWDLAQYCPEYFDPQKFNWLEASYALAKYCPQHFDPQKFNWEKESEAVAKYCPQHFDPEKFNWERASWAVAEYCPQYFDPEKYNWKQFSWAVARYCPQHFDPEKFNWESGSDAVKQYCPEKLKYCKQKKVKNFDLKSDFLELLNVIHDLITEPAGDEAIKMVNDQIDNAIKNSKNKLKFTN